MLLGVVVRARVQRLIGAIPRVDLVVVRVRRSCGHHAMGSATGHTNSDPSFGPRPQPRTKPPHPCYAGWSGSWTAAARAGTRVTSGPVTEARRVKLTGRRTAAGPPQSDWAVTEMRVRRARSASGPIGRAMAGTGCNARTSQGPLPDHERQAALLDVALDLAGERDVSVLRPDREVRIRREAGIPAPDRHSRSKPSAQWSRTQCKGAQLL